MKKHDNYDEIAKLCRTCKKSTALKVSGDFLCKKFGVVRQDYVCRKYKLNESLPRPPKQRTIMDTAKFNINDFTV